MSEKYTILIDACLLSNEPSGVDRYLRSLLSSLVPLLAEDEWLHVLYPAGVATDAFPVSEKLIFHPVDARYDTLACRRQSLSIARRLRPDVFHTPDLTASVHFPGRTVVTLHNLLPATHPHFCTFFRRMRWKFRAFHTVYHSRRIIAVSEDVSRSCEKFFGKRILSTGEVIRPGVSSSFFPCPDTGVEALRAKYRLPEKFFLYLGADAPSKNLDTLLDAYRLLDSTTTFPLVMAGFESRGSRTLDIANSLDIGNRIQWLGRVPEADLPALYTAAHSFLFPSLDEGFCFPVLEAMSCGTPVICSALNVLKEVTDDAAKVVHPTDRQEWRIAIHSAVVSIDWRDTARVRGLARASEFTWENTARKTLAVYRNLYPKRKNHAKSL